MKLSEAIKTNPYLKSSNCVDIDDLNCGIKAVFELERIFGRKKILDNLFEKLHNKKEKIKNKLYQNEYKPTKKPIQLKSPEPKI